MLHQNLKLIWNMLNHESMSNFYRGNGINSFTMLDSVTDKQGQN